MPMLAVRAKCAAGPNIFGYFLFSCVWHWILQKPPLLNFRNPLLKTPFSRFLIPRDLHSRKTGYPANNWWGFPGSRRTYRVSDHPFMWRSSPHQEVTGPKSLSLCSFFLPDWNWGSKFDPTPNPRIPYTGLQQVRILSATRSRVEILTKESLAEANAAPNAISKIFSP